MVDELITGPCIALEISHPDVDDVVKHFRDFAGPSDPEIGKRIRPDSIRALFGEDKVKNAIHCTDLAEDGELEVMTT